MIYDNIVVVRKEEYESLIHDSELANLTRKFLRDADDHMTYIDLLCFIYGIPVPEKKEVQ